LGREFARLGNGPYDYDMPRISTKLQTALVRLDIALDEQLQRMESLQSDLDEQADRLSGIRSKFEEAEARVAHLLSQRHRRALDIS
jgi:chromosome segregation ATPase